MIIELEEMSDEELLDYTAQVELKLRYGRRLKAKGDEIIRENIQLWSNCNSELGGRQATRIENRVKELEDKTGKA